MTVTISAWLGSLLKSRVSSPKTRSIIKREKTKRMRLGGEEGSADTGASLEPTGIKGRQEHFRRIMESTATSGLIHEEIGGNSRPEADPKNGTKEDNTESNLGEKHVDPVSSATLPGSASIRGMLNYDVNTSQGELTVKIICLGDSAVGKSK